MQKRFTSIFLSILVMSGCGTIESTKPTEATFSEAAEALIQQMAALDEENYNTATADGLKISPTSDKKSFYGTWTPEGFNPETDGFIVALHGHGGFVSSGFEAWKPYLDEYHYGYLGLQWWFGEGESIDDYYTPTEMLPLIQAALAEQGIPAGKILFEGFSRGATNTYAMEALDKTSANPLFLMTVANAGGFIADYPPTAEIINGVFGESPFDGTHWVLYCGELDTTLNSTCSDMENTKASIENYGGAVDLFIQDSTEGHGGFHMNSANTKAALDLYEKLRQTPNP